MKSKIRIANGQGFWGDSIDAPVELVKNGNIDYLTLDYLAEVTMAIMQKLRMRNPKMGYATDFVDLIERILPDLVEKDIKVIANAGGVNPTGCVEAIIERVEKLGITGIKIAIVEGDDILESLDDLMKNGCEFKNMDNGGTLDTVRDKVLSANVYIGADSILEALEAGAQIIVTGRSTDTALTMAPMIHEFGWKLDNWDKLASGTIAGHIIECGAQCSGGNFSNWEEVPDLANIGYPIIEAYPDGTFVVTKSEKSGGLVSVDTVSEQLLYEMGNPEAYITPDVTAFFTSINLEQESENRVKVSGIKGGSRTPTLKVSINYLNGFKAVGQLTISGPNALAKAKVCADIVFKRLEKAGITFAEEDKTVEFLGVNTCHEGIGEAPNVINEVVLRIGVKDQDKAKVNRFGKEIAPLVTSGPPGVTGFAGGRPKATEIVEYWPALMPRELVPTTVTVREV
ncbi:MAG: DUF1446 domain-containing protein [Calditrichaeota bacterium]|nr:MAG: DUF1446 domain-containing protein [Calditrichota bacterium]